MAKLSSINKNERRKKLAKKYAGRYAKLKAMAKDTSLDESERLIARLKMAEIPRNGNPHRVSATGVKPQVAHVLITVNSGCAVSNCVIWPIRALIPGVTKSSW